MKRNVWLTVHGEQQYEGMSADSSDLRVRGTMEETRDGYLLRYEETDGDGKVTTATRLALAPDCIILTRTGEVTSEIVFAEVSSGYSDSKHSVQNKKNHQHCKQEI